MAGAFRVRIRGEREAMTTILLVEDDPPLRTMIERALAKSGYRLLHARNGAEALDVAASCPEPIDLLVTDVLMPQIGGFELVARLRERYPHTKVLYMTGAWDDSVAVRGGLKETGDPYLLKPFTRDELLRKIHELIENP